jgi:hypothetical protein
MSPRRAAVGGLGLGLAIALAANATYAIPRGGVVIGLGLIAPLVLPVVLHLRTTFTVDGFWAKLVREVATLAVAGPAVAVSYSHTMQLVLDAGEPRLIALLAPLSSDGLAGLATLALYRHQVGRRRAKTKPAAPLERQTPPPPPAVEAPDEEPDELARARELVAKGRQDGAKYGRASLARDLGVTPHRARELLAQIDAVHLVVGA